MCKILEIYYGSVNCMSYQVDAQCPLQENYVSYLLKVFCLLRRNYKL